MTHRTLLRGAAIAAALCLISTPALAQKKPPKGKPPATKPAEPEPAAPATDAAGAAPKEEAAPGADDAAATEDKDAKKKDVAPPPEEWDDTDVTEKPGKKYYFVGLRYRGTIVPKFLMNMFVDEGGTFYSNTFGAELDVRKDDFSFIPALTYVEYSTGGDMIFKEKNKEDTSNNWSAVNSHLKAIYITADLLWSTKVHKNWDFEYGAGFGLGVLFGSLENNWLYFDPNGNLERSDGRKFSKCQNERQFDLPQPPNQPVNGIPTCDRRAHSNAAEPKVDNYKEKFWTGGGSIPNVFIHLAVPELGVRWKPRKDIAARFGFGFSLTGFWLGLSANYGLETLMDKPASSPSSGPATKASSFLNPQRESGSGPQLVTGQSLQPFSF